MDPMLASLDTWRTPALRRLQAQHAVWSLVWAVGLGMFLWSLPAQEPALILGAVPWLLVGSLGGLAVQARAVGAATDGPAAPFVSALVASLAIGVVFQIAIAVHSFVGSLMMAGLGGALGDEWDAIYLLGPAWALGLIALVATWTGVHGLALVHLGHGSVGEALSAALADARTGLPLGLRWLAWHLLLWLALALLVGGVSPFFLAESQYGYGYGYEMFPWRPIGLTALVNAHTAVAFVRYVARREVAVDAPAAAPAPRPAAAPAAAT